MAAEHRFPLDWLAPNTETATDLDLAVLLVNSYDALADPPDRLSDLRWFRAVLRDVGHGSLARALRPDDVEPLRTLREQLRPAFTAADARTAARVLNPLLTAAGALPTLVPDTADPRRARLDVGVGAQGLVALRQRLPAALARHVADYGAHRLAACGSAPCHCVYVDRTRAATRRYCCSWCNDRAAARAYRRRQRG